MVEKPGGRWNSRRRGQGVMAGAVEKVKVHKYLKICHVNEE